jgi:ABC-type phosphate transport system auxiliary subunit
MAQKTENLEAEILERLKFLRDETDKIVIFLGQLAVQERTLQKRLKEVEDTQEKYGAMNDKYIFELEEKLGELDKKYKNGQIDLDNGIITFEE